MKILIIGFTKLKYMPYIHFYLDQIDSMRNDIHVLYWNRDGKNEDKDNSINYHEFSCVQQDDVPKYKKIINFIKYRKFVTSILKCNKFDLIFVLHSIPGVLCYDILISNYNQKYIFDYRDYTYENISIFRNVVMRLSNHSYATFVSSNAFRIVLPKINKIYTSHNILLDSLKYRNGFHSIRKKIIKIAFWGFIRHEKINKEIIKKIAGDRRFELHYYGREQSIALNLKKYSQNINAENVYFHGEYTPEERYAFAKKTDIIHNIYSNDEMPHTKYAIGNKYYDGIIFKIPQICMPDSYMGKAVTTAGVGLECNPYSENFPNDIWEYYQRLSFDHFSAKCDKELERILNEYMQGAEIIKNAIHM